MVMPEDVLRFLATRSKWMVLYALYKHGSMSGREISRQSGISWMPAGSALQALVEAGILNFELDRNRKVYSLNERHFLYGPLEKFFLALDRCNHNLLDTLRNRFKQWGEPILLNMGICDTDRLVLVTKDRVSSTRIIAGNVARILDEMGYRGKTVEIYAIQQITDDHSLRSTLERSCIWVGGSLERIKDILGGGETDRRLAFFDF